MKAFAKTERLYAVKLPGILLYPKRFAFAATYYRIIVAQKRQATPATIKKRITCMSFPERDDTTPVRPKQPNNREDIPNNPKLAYKYPDITPYGFFVNV